MTNKEKAINDVQCYSISHSNMETALYGKTKYGFSLKKIIKITN